MQAKLGIKFFPERRYFCRHDQSVYGIHPALFLMDIWDHFPGSKMIISVLQTLRMRGGIAYLHSSTTIHILVLKQRQLGWPQRRQR
jgi:hypothetical protein